MSYLELFEHRFANLPDAFYTRVTPQPLESTTWVAWNSQLASELGLPTSEPVDELDALLKGELQRHDKPSLAMKYAGHQFGAYNPDLGDGRGLLLGELKHQNGTWFDVHLKGAGLTPYSRMGDGRAVLRSTIREYLGSEALHGLGIATTRALGMFTSKTPVYREKQEFGAMLLRVSETHIRFGHFEHFFYTNQTENLKLLADKVIEWHMPECNNAQKPYLAMFNQTVERTALMIAQWQAFGFTHGVMNTDNMSILGQTFDYGPYGFMDSYQPRFIPNHSDHQGRYAFNQQPNIALWNLSALGYALTPLIEKPDLESALQKFETLYSEHFSTLMRKKLGLLSKQSGDSELFADMFELLASQSTDYTRFIRQLSYLDSQPAQTVLDLFIDRERAKQWLDRYLLRCELEGDARTRCQKMRQINPKYVLRNYLAQIAIERAEQGDFSEVHRLAKLVKTPFDEQPEFEDYAKLPPAWASEIEISCSS